MGDAVGIGSDAVPTVVHEFIRSGPLEGLDLQYGSDGYGLLSLKQPQGQCLVVAGGSGR